MKWPKIPPHPLTVPPDLAQPTGPKPGNWIAPLQVWTCEYCQMTFNTWPAYQLHLMNQHPQQLQQTYSATKNLPTQGVQSGTLMYNSQGQLYVYDGNRWKPINSLSGNTFANASGQHGINVSNPPAASKPVGQTLYGQPPVSNPLGLTIYGQPLAHSPRDPFKQGQLYIDVFHAASQLILGAIQDRYDTTLCIRTHMSNGAPANLESQS